MNGENSNTMKCLGTDNYILSGSWQCNATSSPLVANSRYPVGFLWTVARTGVGLYVVTLDPSMNLPSLPFYIDAQAQYATLATDWFECGIVGEFNLATRVFSVQCHRSGVAQEVAATAGNRVSFQIAFRNSTSR